MNPLVLLLAPIALNQLCEYVREHLGGEREKERILLREKLEKGRDARIAKLEERLEAMEKEVRRRKK